MSNILNKLNGLFLDTLGIYITQDGLPETARLITTVNVGGKHRFDQFTTGKYYSELGYAELGSNPAVICEIARHLAVSSDNFSKIAQREYDVDVFIDGIVKLKKPPRSVAPIIDQAWLEDSERKDCSLELAELIPGTNRNGDKPHWYEPQGYKLSLDYLKKGDLLATTAQMLRSIKEFLSESYAGGDQPKWEVTLFSNGKMIHTENKVMVDYHSSLDNGKDIDEQLKAELLTLLNLESLTGFNI
ncbi:hypothetical protein C9J21_17835 [Photobacterium phosphoreum]|uniref:hypothetical protein n=1 Tax=Photobacterium phosphoreum TaxID=659 RepID=UPI000D179E39|nr:hypothetical protein [Photobacterium phosphoreum]PSW31210.1 hypothetical protein C9J21_17835 [Photobacterium phosphoreum]